MIRSAGIIGANYGGDDLLPLVAPVDIAVAAEEELTGTSGGRNVRYIVSDEQTARSIAAAIGNAIGMPGLQWLVFTNEQAEVGMVQNGVPAPLARLFTELGASLHNGRLVTDYVQHRPVTFGQVKLADFVQEFATVYHNPTATTGHGS